MLAEPFIAEFVEKNNLGYTDTMVEVVETIFAECKIPSGTRPTMAVVDWPASYEILEGQLRQNAQVFDQLGIDALPCHIGQLRLEDDSIWLGDRQIDVIYRVFLMEDLLDPAGPALIEPVLRAAERGQRRHLLADGRRALQRQGRPGLAVGRGQPASVHR